jgi:predicted O-linked N-acetylglucosamine transferase (SPINDLY family)
VAASLLNAVGLPELVVSSDREYIDMAVNLSVDHHRLSAIRARLEDSRNLHPLFDAVSYVRDLEEAFVKMHALSLAGKQADTLYID